MCERASSQRRSPVWSEHPPHFLSQRYQTHAAIRRARSRRLCLGRLWLNDGSCVRLRPTHRNHVWSYDFAADRTADGRSLRMLVIVDEHTRECLAIDVARKLTSEDL